MPKNMLLARGSSAIPMTPFDDDDRIDVGLLEREIDFIARSGATSICTPVMVSEFESLSEEERKLMIRVPIEVNAGRCAVIANVAAVNRHLAVEYAEYAEKMGADCVIAMGPYARPTEFPVMKQYFKAIAGAVSLPVMIQNASNNAQLSARQVVELCEEIENVRYIKQEVVPGPVTISALLALKSPAVEMVMSGFGGVFTPMDHARGAIATIHACEFCDLVQRVWNLLDEGKHDEALALQGAILPALQLENLLGMTYAKEIMIRRGIFKNNRTRTRTEDLTEADRRDIDNAWAAIEKLI